MRLARHDSLTGLASRPLFLEKLAQRLEEVSHGGDEVAVLFMGDADVAMYQAKQKGRGCYSIFGPDMHTWFVHSA